MKITDRSWWVCALLTAFAAPIFAQKPKEPLPRKVYDQTVLFMARYQNLMYYEGVPDAKPGQEFDLMEMFVHDQDGAHYNDLMDGSKSYDYDIAFYLGQTERLYQNHVQVRYTEPRVDHCIVTNKQGTQYMLAHAEKEVALPNGKKLNYRSAFTFDVSDANNPRLEAVREWLDAAKCSTTGVSQEEKKRAAQELVRRGDEAFQAKDFENAKSFYQKAIAQLPGDVTIQSKINQCDQQLNCAFYQNAAEQAYEAKNYRQALDYFNKIKTCPNRPNNLEDRIRSCELETLDASTRTKFLEFKSRGDDMAGKLFFQKAIEYYREALKLKPNDTYCKDKIATCERDRRAGRDRPVLEDLARARQLFQKGGTNNYTTATAIVVRLEPSGLLNGADYLAAGQWLDIYNDGKGIRKQLGFSKTFSRNLGRIFLHKAAFGNVNSEGIWFANYRRDAQILWDKLDFE